MVNFKQIDCETVELPENITAMNPDDAIKEECGGCRFWFRIYDECRKHVIAERNGLSLPGSLSIEFEILKSHKDKDGVLIIDDARPILGSMKFNGELPTFDDWGGKGG